MNNFSNPIFHDETKAREWLENRIWPNGPVCPHCTAANQCTLMKGKTTRPGLYQCNACKEPFTVTVGTLYERSHIPLHKWLAATFLLMSSKKGMSALQIGRMLDISPKSSWFLCHRIRESLKPNYDRKHRRQLGGKNSKVEIDETYIGGLAKNKHAKKRLHAGTGPTEKMPVVSLVKRKDRKNTEVRSFHVPRVTAETLRPIVYKHISKKSHLMTDSAIFYPALSGRYAAHSSVNHTAGEYVKGDAHNNTVENYFSILKRGIIGVYHYVSPQHLNRYLAEFDFRYNNRQGQDVSDFERMNRSVPGIVGRRLVYKVAVSKAA